MITNVEQPYWNDSRKSFFKNRNFLLRKIPSFLYGENEILNLQNSESSTLKLGDLKSFKIIKNFIITTKQVIFKRRQYLKILISHIDYPTREMVTIDFQKGKINYLNKKSTKISRKISNEFGKQNQILVRGYILYIIYEVSVVVFSLKTMKIIGYINLKNLEVDLISDVYTYQNDPMLDDADEFFLIRHDLGVYHIKLVNGKYKLINYKKPKSNYPSFPNQNISFLQPWKTKRNKDDRDSNEFHFKIKLFKLDERLGKVRYFLLSYYPVSYIKKQTKDTIYAGEEIEIRIVDIYFKKVEEDVNIEINYNVIKGDDFIDKSGVMEVEDPRLSVSSLSMIDRIRRSNIIIQKIPDTPKVIFSLQHGLYVLEFDNNFENVINYLENDLFNNFYRKYFEIFICKKILYVNSYTLKPKPSNKLVKFDNFLENFETIGVFGRNDVKIFEGDQISEGFKYTNAVKNDFLYDKFQEKFKRITYLLDESEKILKMDEEELLEKYKSSISIPEEEARNMTEKQIDDRIIKEVGKGARETMNNYSRVKIGYNDDDYLLIPKYLFRNRLNDTYNLVDENIDLEKYDVLKYLLGLKGKNLHIGVVLQFLKNYNIEYKEMLIELYKKPKYSNFILKNKEISIPILKEIFILESDMFEHLIYNVVDDLIFHMEFDISMIFESKKLLKLYVQYTLLNEVNPKNIDDEFYDKFVQWRINYENLKHLQIKWWIN